MTITTSDPASLDLWGPQWDFAVGLYQKPGVSEACLTLQDALGVDVCLLLFALFAASEHDVQLDRVSLQELDRVVAEWRDQVVRPLRAIRRRLKGDPPPQAASDVHALREQIKKSEIEAEQIELAMLGRHFSENPPAPRTEPADISAVLDEVADYFAMRSGNATAQAPEMRSALRDIAAAVDGVARPG